MSARLAVVRSARMVIGNPPNYVLREIEMSQFTTYRTAQAAAIRGCFNCTEPLDIATFMDAGHAPAWGQYSMRCASCGMLTYFDIKHDNNAAVTV